MFRRSSLAIIVLGLLSDGTSAADKPDVEDAIARAVQQLGDARFAVREKASEELEKIGWAARPALRKASRDADLEIANRARKILKKQRGTVPPGTSAKVAKLVATLDNGENHPFAEPLLDQLLEHHADSPEIIVDQMVGQANDEDRWFVLNRYYRFVPDLASKLLLRGKVTEAEELLELRYRAFCAKSLKSDYPEWSPISDYAAILVERPRLEETLVRLEKQVERSGEKNDATLLTFLYLQRGDLKAARKAVEKAERPEILEQILLVLEDWKALSALPAPADAQTVPRLAKLNTTRKATAHRYAGDDEKAEALIALLRDADPSRFPGVEPLERATSLLLSEQPTTAVYLLLTKLKDERSRFNLLCGQLRFEEAFALKDPHPTLPTGFKLDRARALLRLEERRRAEGELKALLALIRDRVNPEDYYIKEAAESLPVTEERWKDVRSIYRPWKPVAADSWVWPFMDQLLKGSQDTEETRRRLKKASVLPLGNPRNRLSLARELFSRGEHQLAEREFERIVTNCLIDTCDIQCEALTYLSKFAAQRGDHARAVRYQQQSCYLMGANYHAASLPRLLVLSHRLKRERARAHLVAGRTDQARQAIRDCLELLPGNIELPIALVPVLEAKRLQADADRLFDSVFGNLERLRAAYPRCPWIHHHTAWLCVRCGRKLDLAFQCAKKAVELEPTKWYHLDTLAEAHFQKGNQEDAIKCLQLCLAGEKDSSYFLKQLARFRKGDPKAPLPAEIDWLYKTEEACLLSELRDWATALP